MGLFSRSKVVNGWLAISVDGDGVRAVAVERPAGAQPVLRQAVFAPAAASSAQLEKLAKELGAARWNVTTLLGAGQYQILSIDAPNVPADELKTAVRWRLKDMIDFPVDDATVDVLPIPADKAAPTRANTLFAVAARSRAVRERQDLFADAKTPLRAIDIPEAAQRNIAALAEPEGRALAMLAFDDHSGLLTVSYGGELYLSRRIELGLAQLSDASHDNRAAAYDRITLELQRSLDHFDRQFHTLALSKLMLGPMGEARAPLLAYLGSNLYVPAEPLDLGALIDLSATPELARAEAQQPYFFAIGAALRVEEGAA